MARIWQTAADEKVCYACQALDGKRDGDGWCSALAQYDHVYVQQPNGTWLTLVRGQVPSGPPLHTNCRCSTTNDPSRKSLLITYDPPATPPLTTEEFSRRLLYDPDPLT